MSFLIAQLTVNALIAGSLYALGSSGLSLTFGTLRILNFAHGHFMMLGAYIFYWLYEVQSLGIGGAAVASMVLVTALGYGCFSCFIRPFQGLNPLLPFVSTLSLAAMAEAMVSLQFGVNVKSFRIGNWGQSLSFYGVYITPLQIFIICSALVSLSWLAWLIHSTAFGRKLNALAERPESAQALGIPGQRYVAAAFALGVLLAAFGGILVGFETNLQPTMGNSYTIKAFAAMVLGGLGNIWGTILGSFLLGFIENFALGLDFWGYSLPAGYRDGFSFSIILLMLLFRPQGLLGKRQRSI